jgi:hypothetical protein
VNGRSHTAQIPPHVQGQHINIELNETATTANTTNTANTTTNNNTQTARQEEGENGKQ